MYAVLGVLPGVAPTVVFLVLPVLEEFIDIVLSHMVLLRVARVASLPYGLGQLPRAVLPGDIAVDGSQNFTDVVGEGVYAEGLLATWQVTVLFLLERHND